MVCPGQARSQRLNPRLAWRPCPSPGVVTRGRSRGRGSYGSCRWRAVRVRRADADDDPIRALRPVSAPRALWFLRCRDAWCAGEGGPGTRDSCSGDPCGSCWPGSGCACVLIAGNGSGAGPGASSRPACGPSCCRRRVPGWRTAPYPPEADAVASGYADGRSHAGWSRGCVCRAHCAPSHQRSACSPIGSRYHPGGLPAAGVSASSSGSG
jgi:hypothetical protein